MMTICRLSFWTIKCDGLLLSLLCPTAKSTENVRNALVYVMSFWVVYHQFINQLSPTHKANITIIPTPRYHRGCHPRRFCVCLCRADCAIITSGGLALFLFGFGWRRFLGTSSVVRCACADRRGGIA